MEADRARKEGSIISQLLNVGEQQRLQNMKVINALIWCTHFLAHQHIAHTTNFDKLVELVVSCGGETLQTVLDRAGGNATYTSKIAVAEFGNDLGTWVEESLLKRLHKAPFLSIMADECTIVTTIEEQTICCRWVESGVPEEHFNEKEGWQSSHLIHCLSTVTVMSFNLLMCKLLMLHLVSSKSTLPWWRYGSSFITPQNVQSHWRRFRKY